jgi:hypothetical protein
MRFDLSHLARSWSYVSCAAGILCGLVVCPSLARDREPSFGGHRAAEPLNSYAAASARHHSPRREVEPRGGRYFVEFRSRYALSYGHTFLVYGQLNSRGEVGQVTADQVAGLHPAGEGPQLWSVGHVIPVPAETGPSDGDLEDQYISARFRIVMDEAQFRRVAAHIRRKQRTSVMWHAVLYNCNRWVGEVASYMGLKAPSNTMLYPPEYIASLRSLNIGRVRDSQQADTALHE